MVGTYLSKYFRVLPTLGRVTIPLLYGRGGAAGPLVGTSFLGGNGAGEKQPKFTYFCDNNNTCLLGAPARRPAQTDALLSSTSSAIRNNSNAAETQDKDPRARVCVHNRVSSGCFLR